MISHSVMKGLRRTYSPYAYVFRRPLEDVLIKTNILILLRRRLQDLDVFQKHLQDVLQKRLQGIFRDFFKTFWRRLQDVTRNFAEFSTKHLCRNLFLLSCEFCEIFCKNTFFPEQQRMTASDYSSINSSKGNIGKRNCKLWYKN